jgi:hypothetical protein
MSTLMCVPCRFHADVLDFVTLVLEVCPPQLFILGVWGGDRNCFFLYMNIQDIQKLRGDA